MLIIGRCVRGQRHDHSRTGRPACLNSTNGSCGDRKSTRLNSSHGYISYAVFCLKKKKSHIENECQDYPHDITQPLLHAIYHNLHIIISVDDLDHMYDWPLNRPVLST